MPETTMSDDVMALSGEIDDAITAMNKEEETRGELVDEKAEGKVTGDLDAVGGLSPEAEETDPATKEVENVEGETKDSEVGGEETDDGRAEDPEETLPPQVSDDTLERAVAAGIPVVDAKALTPESLERVIRARVEAAYEPPEVIEPAKKEKPKDLFADLPELNKENYEPEMIAQIESIKEIARRQQVELQEFRDHGEQVSSRANQAAEREMEVWYDGQVEGLGEDFKEALGEGGYSTMDRSSQQFENRDAIVEQMSVMFAGYHAQGLPVPSREQVFDTAVGLVLRDTYAGIQNKKIQGDLAKQSKQHIRRAGGGKAKSELSDEDAIAAEIEKQFG